MPVPVVLNDQKHYALVWSGPLNVGVNVRNPQKGQVTKTFHAYVETYEQSAHDAALATYCHNQGGGTRSPHRAQVQPANVSIAPLVYYFAHGMMASQLAANFMQQQWTANAGGNATVFQVGLPRQLTVQGVRQANGFHYDVTMWYDVSDVYVAFHCYHP